VRTQQFSASKGGRVVEAALRLWNGAARWATGNAQTEGETAKGAVVVVVGRKGRGHGEEGEMLVVVAAEVHVGCWVFGVWPSVGGEGHLANVAEGGKK
jgi:hypothetical protein